MKQSNIVLTFTSNRGPVEFAAFNPITGAIVHGDDIRGTQFTLDQLADNDISVSKKELTKFVSQHAARGSKIVTVQDGYKAVCSALGVFPNVHRVSLTLHHARELQASGTPINLQGEKLEPYYVQSLERLKQFVEYSMTSIDATTPVLIDRKNNSVTFEPEQ